MTDLEPALRADARVAPSEPASRRAAWPVVALCGLVVIAACWAVAGSHWLEPNLSTNLDEQAYLHQAELLARGHLSVSVPSPDLLARNFQPWFAAATDHGYIFKYNLVWPAVLTVTTFLSAPRLALALAIALFLVGTYFLAVAVLRSRAKSVVAAAVVALSPLTLIQSTTVLSYVLFGGLWTLAAAALLRGIIGSNRHLAIAGALGALAFCARPFDALIVLVPFAAWAVWATRRDRDALARAARWTVGAATPILVVQAAYNTYVTGVPWKLPYSLWSTTDRLGFGDRGLLATGVPQVHFGPRQGVHAVAVNLWSLHVWAFGGVVLVILAVLGVAALRRRAESFPLVAVGVVVPASYVFFWGIANISLLSKAIDRFGPYYFLPVLVPLAVFGTEGAARVWSWHRWALACLGVVALVTTVIGTSDAVSAALGERDARAQPYKALATIAAGARAPLVFLPGPYIGTSVLDRYSVDTHASAGTLYAAGNGNVDLALLAHYPERTPYRLVACAYAGQAPLGSDQYPADAAATEALVTGTGARAQRLHTTTPARDLTMHVLVDPDAARDGTVEVAAGEYRASAPLRPSTPAGPAAVTVRVDPRGLTLEGDVGDVVTSRGRDAPLSIRTLTRDPASGLVRSRSWSAPVQLGADEVAALVPGQTFTSPDFPATPDAETCHPDAALQVQIEAAGG